MYIPVLPIPVETQPLLCLAAGTISAAISTHLILRHDKTSLLALVLLIFIVIGFLYSLANRQPAISDLVKYSIGPIIYISMRNRFFNIPKNLTIYSTYLLFAVSIFMFFDIGPVKNIIGLIIERASQSDIGGIRGISLISNEPSYAAGQLIFLLLTLKFQNEIYKTNSIHTKIAPTLAITMILMTKSALGYLFLIAYFTPEILRQINLKKMLLIAAFGLGVTIMEFIFPSRISQVISAFQQADINNLLLSLSILEPSGTTRIFLNAAAFSSILFSPFGYGLGSFSDVWHHTLDKLGLQILQNHEILGSVYMSQQQTFASTYLANITNDLGLPALIITLSMFSPFILKLHNNSIFLQQVSLCLIIMLFFQSQITNPIPWALLIMGFNYMGIINNKLSTIDRKPEQGKENRGEKPRAH